MALPTRQYPSKILLFGEYLIIRGAKALALPCQDFSGRWSWSPAGSRPEELAGLLGYLEELQEAGALLAKMDLGAFSGALARGLFFESAIPMGYGLGSSGALVAAVYEAFCTAPESAPEGLRVQLAQIESYFHGSSSGIDPLVCLLDKPLLLQNREQAEIVENPVFRDAEQGALFLLDTGMGRETAPLVRIFLEKCEDPLFADRLENRLAPLSDAAIRSCLAGDWRALMAAFEGISRFQRENFEEMIPAAFRPLWEKGLDSPHYKIKLCGAGGGGFLLGIAPDLEAACRELFPYALRPILSGQALL